MNIILDLALSTFFWFFLKDSFYLKPYRNSLYSKRGNLVGGLEHSQHRPSSPMREKLTQIEVGNKDELPEGQI